MAGSVQLPQDILKMDVKLNFNSDPLRKFLVDILTRLNTLETENKQLKDRIAALES